MSSTDAVSIIKQGGNKISLTVRRLPETNRKLYVIGLLGQYSVSIFYPYLVGGAKTTCSLYIFKYYDMKYVT